MTHMANINRFIALVCELLDLRLNHERQHPIPYDYRRSADGLSFAYMNFPTTKLIRERIFTLSLAQLPTALSVRKVVTVVFPHRLFGGLSPTDLKPFDLLSPDDMHQLMDESDKWVHVAENELSLWKTIVEKPVIETLSPTVGHLMTLARQIEEREQLTGSSGLVELTHLFTTIMSAHLNDIRVTLSRKDVARLQQALMHNVEGS